MIQTIHLLLVTLGLISSVPADNFELTLTVDPANRPGSARESAGPAEPLVSDKDRPVSTKETVETPSAQKPAPRPVVKLTCDKPAGVSWHVQNASKSEKFENLLVHFFVVKEKKTGQREVPELTANVTYEGALTMDFDPKGDADWEWTLNIHEPGSYLLRVETIGMQEQHGHELYAAMDLVVE